MLTQLPTTLRPTGWCLTSMLSKRVERNSSVHFPYVLFAYEASVQESTRESPYFLLHGCDPRLSSVWELEPPQEVNLGTYKGKG